MLFNNYSAIRPAFKGAASGGDIATLQANHLNPITRLANTLLSVSRRWWSDYRTFVSSTIYYDDYGTGHSTLLWY